jgi:hypothetical protein
MEKMLEGLLESLEGSFKKKDRILERSVPAKKEWIDEHNKLSKLAKRVSDDMHNLKIGRERMWARIQLDLDDFETGKTFNTDTNEIEIYALRDDEKPVKGAVKSPLSEI